MAHVLCNWAAVGRSALGNGNTERGEQLLSPAPRQDEDAQDRADRHLPGLGQWLRQGPAGGHHFMTIINLPSKWLLSGSGRLMERRTITNYALS